MTSKRRKNKVEKLLFTPYKRGKRVKNKSTGYELGANPEADKIIWGYGVGSRMIDRLK